MTDNEACTLEKKYPVRVIESQVLGLKYAVDDDRMGVLISGMKGKTALDIRQAKALCKELPGILEGMGYSCE